MIYLDCGDFHLIEGSHSFKIWVYLASPDNNLRSYEHNNFTHHQLTSSIPQKYRQHYPGLPHDAIVHQPHTWQNKVFVFLANNGIGLDIEQLLDERDYNIQLRRYGIPVVKGAPPKVHTAQQQEKPQTGIILASSSIGTKKKTESDKVVPSNNTLPAEHRAARNSLAEDITKDDHPEQTPTEHKLATGTLSADLLKRLRSAHGNPKKDSRQTPQPAELLKPEKFSPLHSAILNYLKGKPSCNIHELATATKLQGGNARRVTMALKDEMAPYVSSNSESYWTLSHEGLLAWQVLFSNSSGPVTAKPQNKGEDSPKKYEGEITDSYSAATELEMKNLSPVSLKILDYFSINSGDRVRSAAKVMDMETSLVNQHLYGPLKNMLIKDDNHGWHLTPTVRNMLNRTERR
ncbi:EH signature domain-containing protein [Zobellella denitrificans]|uniref:EH signature domain-containing protein n=1 Tax=Zobellella denitrificans TaxID=347534 RepID=UPI001C3CBD42|nr:EH signature domain-containing protein [Zobellella denitrificans]